MQNKSLAPAGDFYPVLAPEGQDEIRDLYQANLTSLDLDPNLLPRDKCGAGGATDFRIQTPDGETNIKTLKGIIINVRKARLMFPEDGKLGKRPPVCTSKDGFTGIGVPGGSCPECRYAQFGSSVKGHGQACKQIYQLLILHPEEIIPHVLAVPPTSLKAAGQYFLMLLSRKIAYWSVVTRVQMERAQNQDGIDYAKMQFFVERYLNDEERATFAPLQREMRTLLDPVVVDARDYSVEDEQAPPPRGEEPNSDNVPF
jgi:hypothetical protein